MEHGKPMIYTNYEGLLLWAIMRDDLQFAIFANQQLKPINDSLFPKGAWTGEEDINEIKSKFIAMAELYEQYEEERKTDIKIDGHNGFILPFPTKQHRKPILN